MGRGLFYRIRKEIRSSNRGYYIDKNGYFRFKSSDRLVHRFIAEKYVVGRKLKPFEIVHHRNGNKLDNRNGNLEVITPDEHKTRHPIKSIRWKDNRNFKYNPYNKRGKHYSSYCTECGKGILLNSNYCNHCGRRI